MTNLAIPTPFSYIDTYYVYDCATNPLTLSVWYTAIVQGVPYSAAHYDAITANAAPTVYASYVFPDLTVTSLTPGEEITLVHFPHAYIN